VAAPALFAPPVPRRRDRHCDPRARARAPGGRSHPAPARRSPPAARPHRGRSPRGRAGRRYLRYACTSTSWNCPRVIGVYT